MLSEIPPAVLPWLLGVLGVFGLTIGGAPAPNRAAAPVAVAAPAPATTRVATVSAKPGGAARSISLGVWQPGTPWEFGSLDRFDAMVGKHAAIVHWYQGWGVDSARLDVAQLQTVAARASTPMITWEPWDYRRGVQQYDYRLARIAAGDFDTYVRDWARQLAAYRQPVLLRFMHEMNGDWYPWARGVSGNTPAQYIAAWRHVHEIFSAAGATNVQWVWSPNIAWDAGSAFEQYFPGDRYVDWVALDGYNHPDWGGWKSFDQLFGDSYARLAKLSRRPVMLAEVGSTEGASPADKAAWIRDAFDRIEHGYPRISAVLWFNEAQPGQDWRVNSTWEAQQAFAGAVSSPAYRSRLP